MIFHNGSDITISARCWSTNIWDLCDDCDGIVWLYVHIIYYIYIYIYLFIIIIVVVIIIIVIIIVIIIIIIIIMIIIIIIILIIIILLIIIINIIIITIIIIYICAWYMIYDIWYATIKIMANPHPIPSGLPTQHMIRIRHAVLQHHEVRLLRWRRQELTIQLLADGMFPVAVSWPFWKLKGKSMDDMIHDITWYN